MSYDLSLVDPNSRIILESKNLHNFCGGTYAVGGTTHLSINITYNYWSILERVLGEKGIREIYGMTAKESVDILDKAINTLQGNRDKDYWKATDGNVKDALSQVRSLALLALSMNTNAVWIGD